MARLNLEDSWWTDPRRERLGHLLGDSVLADGVAVRAWRLAQEYWKRGRLIPESIFNSLRGSPQLLEVGLAGVREVDGERGIYICGSSEHLEWLKAKKAGGSKGGKASATRPRDSRGRLQKTPKQSPSTVQADSKLDPSLSKPLTLPLTLPLSPALEEEKKEEAKFENREPLPGGELQAYAVMPGMPAHPAAAKKSKFSELTRIKMRSFIAAYAEAYRAKYGGPPECLKDKALMGKLGNWIEYMAEDRAVGMVQVFMQIDHRQITNEEHSLWLFFRHLNRIGNALNTGKDAGSIDWGQVFATGGAA